MCYNLVFAFVLLEFVGIDAHLWSEYDKQTDKGNTRLVAVIVQYRRLAIFASEKVERERHVDVADVSVLPVVLGW